MSQFDLADLRGDGDGSRALEACPHRICNPPAQKWEQWWVRGGEWLNPILVKEVRQALKSRQFELSFGLTLVAAIAWTFLAVAIALPSIYYVPSGATLLGGYLFLLSVPLHIVIPFSAFRSLTSEIEESTYEMLCITQLSARQIVEGKMATASLQVLLYVSALAPCIVMTYLLRGISLWAVLLVLLGGVAYSLLLVAMALLVAAASQTRTGQSGMSVLLLAILVISFFSTTSTLLSSLAMEWMSATPPREIWVILFATLTLFWAVYKVLMQAAAAAIDFPSENKSTAVRWRLLVLVGLASFWYWMWTFSLGTSRGSGVEEFQYFLHSCFFAVALGVGGLICGERGVVSPRAQRTLPATFLGRVFLTWMGPGAGLGYIFLVLVCGCLMVTELMLLLILPDRIGYPNPSPMLLMLWGLFGYLVFYVGVCRLIMLMIGRRMAAPMVVSFTVLVTLLLLCHLVPYFLAAWLSDFREVEYGWHQSLNIFMTMYEATSGNWSGILPSLTILTLASGVVFGLNLLLATRDVMLVRIGVPERVQLEQSPPRPVAGVPDPFA
jgi:hypothetical protein